MDGHYGNFRVGIQNILMSSELSVTVRGVLLAWILILTLVYSLMSDWVGESQTEQSGFIHSFEVCIPGLAESKQDQSLI